MARPHTEGSAAATRFGCARFSRISFCVARFGDGLASKWPIGTGAYDEASGRLNYSMPRVHPSRADWWGAVGRGGDGITAAGDQFAVEISISWDYV